MTQDFISQIRQDLGYAPQEITHDGKIYRFSTHPTKKSDTSGWCISYNERCVTYGNWRTGVKCKFHLWGDDSKLTSLKKKQYKKDMEQSDQDVHQFEEQTRLEAQSRSLELWSKACESEAITHSYITKKQIRSYGLKVITFDEFQNSPTLLIPLKDIHGNLWSLQKIYKATDQSLQKRFEKGGRVAGCFHTLGVLENSKDILLCEGYATAASLFESLLEEVPVVCAFSSHNLEPVLKALKGKYPNSRIIIAGDDDIFTEGNPGRKAAERLELNYYPKVKAIFPKFEENSLKDKPTDFNDLHCFEGLETISKQIKEGLLDARGFFENYIKPTLDVHDPEQLLRDIKGKLAQITKEAENLEASLKTNQELLKVRSEESVTAIGKEEVNAKKIKSLKEDIKTLKNDLKLKRQSLVDIHKEKAELEAKLALYERKGHFENKFYEGFLRAVQANETSTIEPSLLEKFKTYLAEEEELKNRIQATQVAKKKEEQEKQEQRREKYSIQLKNNTIIADYYLNDDPEHGLRLRYPELIYTDNTPYIFEDYWQPLSDETMSYEVQEAYKERWYYDEEDKKKNINMSQEKAASIVKTVHTYLKQEAIEGFFHKREIGFNCSNGFIPFTGENAFGRIPHHPNHHQFYILPAPAPENLELDFQSERWRGSKFWKFLEDAFKKLDGSVEQEKIKLIAQVMAVALSGCATKIKNKKLIFLRGDSANNGKSTLIEIITKMLSKIFIAEISPSRMEERFVAIGLKDKILNAYRDVDTNIVLKDTSTLKMAITCENMTSGFKFKDDVTFQAKALHLMSGNGSFSSSKHIDEGLKRRLCVINFGNKIESEIVITDFSDQIVNEESDLILSFALWGARSLIKQSKDGRGELSYDIPKSCDDELEDWLDKDSVRSYVKTQLVVSESAFISSQDAYDNYKKYCKENGEKHVVSLKTFVTTLKTLLPGAYKATEKQRGFKGYCLVGAVSDEDSETLLETKIWNFFNECRSIHTVEIQEETNSSNQKGLAVKIDLNGNEVKHTRDLYGYYKENELYVFCNSIDKVIGRSSDLSCLPHTFYKGIQRRTINGVRQRFHVFVLEEAQEVASSTHINTTSNNVIQLNPKENHLSHKEYHSIPLSEMEETTL